MTYTVHLRCNATGEVRQIVEKGHWRSIVNTEDDWGDEFLWTEGNYGCDCNRHLFFHRAAGSEPEDDRGCGETAYTIVSVTDETGKQIDSELEDSPAPEGDR